MGGHLEPSQVYEYSNIAELADFLSKDAEELLASRASLVREMQRNGHHAPFFCVAPVSGLVLAYRRLSESIGKDQPFYGVEHPGIQVGTQPAESIEAIAERLLQDVLVVMEIKFPGRSLQLGGWSMGGLIAIEMARQLRRNENPLRVDTVVLIDSFAPVPGLPLPTKATMMRSLASDLTSCRATLTTLDDCSDEQLNGMDSEARCRAVQAAVEAALPDWGWGADLWKRVFDVYEANVDAMHRYVPELKDCPELQGLTVQLLRATRGNTHLDVFPGQSKPDCGWSSLFGLPPQRVLLYFIEGDHYLVTNSSTLPATGNVLRILLGPTQDSFQPTLGSTNTKFIETKTHQHWSSSPRKPMSPGKAAEKAEKRFRIASGVSQNEDPKSAAIEAFTAILRDLHGPPNFMLLVANAKFDAHKLCKMLEKLSPDSEILATTSCGGCVNHLGVFSVGLLAIRDSAGKYAVSCAPARPAEPDGPSAPEIAKQAGKDAAREALARAQTIDPPALAVLTCSPGFEEHVLEGISDVLGDVPVLGGSAADDDFGGKWWIASSNSQKSSEGVDVITSGVGIALMWPTAELELMFSSCYKPTAARGVVTEVSGRTILQIDGRPAAQVYSEWTGNPEVAKLLAAAERPQPILPVSALQPIGLHVEGPIISMQGESNQRQFNSLLHPGEITEGDGLACMAGGICEGDLLLGMQADKQELVNHIKAVIARELEADSNVHGAFVVYCGGCSLQIQDALPEVARSFGDALHHKPFLGMFSFGEQGVDPWEQNRHGNLMFSCLVFKSH